MPQIHAGIRDAEALRAACRQLGLPEPALGAFPLGSAVTSGFAVRLPGWRYPVVFQVDTGLVKFDNSHGEQCELDRFLEACAEEQARIEERNEGRAKATSSSGAA